MSAIRRSLPSEPLPAALRVSGRTMSNKWFHTYHQNDAIRRDRFREKLTNLHAEGKIHFAAGQDEQGEQAAMGDPRIHIQGTTNTPNGTWCGF